MPQVKKSSCFSLSNRSKGTQTSSKLVLKKTQLPYRIMHCRRSRLKLEEQPKTEHDLISHTLHIHSNSTWISYKCQLFRKTLSQSSITGAITTDISPNSAPIPKFRTEFRQPNWRPKPVNGSDSKAPRSKTTSQIQTSNPINYQNTVQQSKPSKAKIQSIKR